MTKPTAPQVMQMILDAAAHQVETCEEASAIVAAGLGPQLKELIYSIAANAAGTITWAFEPEEDR